MCLLVNLFVTSTRTPVHRKMTRLAAYYYRDVTSTVNSSVTLFYGLILSIYSMLTTKSGLLDLANLPAKSSVLPSTNSVFMRFLSLKTI